MRGGVVAARTADIDVFPPQADLDPSTKREYVGGGSIVALLCLSVSLLRKFKPAFVMVGTLLERGLS